MTKRQLECAGIAIYGWCDRCKDRVGRKLYRLLVGGSCQDCNRKWGKVVQQETVNDDPPAAQRKKTPASRKKKAPRIKEARTFVRPSEADFRREEEAFLQALHELQLFDPFWVEPIAEHLGWSCDKARKTGRRLKKRGFTIPLGSNGTRLLQLIEEYPWSTAEELHSLMAVSFSHFEKLLRQTVEESSLVVLDSSNFKLRRYHAAMNFLIYASRPTCVCAYSQKFRCYGVFVEDRDPRAIAALKLKHPAIISEKSDFFKYWVPAHSTIVGAGEGVSATTDVLCGFPKGETPIQDCLNEVEGKRQLFLESEARKATFAPGGS